MPEKPKVEQWIETELWNFAHALALDLGLPKSAEDVIHRSMASVIHISHAPTPAPEPTAGLKEAYDKLLDCARRDDEGNLVVYLYEAQEAREKARAEKAEARLAEIEKERSGQ